MFRRVITGSLFELSDVSSKKRRCCRPCSRRARSDTSAMSNAAVERRERGREGGREGRREGGRERAREMTY